MKIESSINGNYVEIKHEGDEITIITRHAGGKYYNCLTTDKFRWLAEYGLKLCDEIEKNYQTKYIPKFEPEPKPGDNVFIVGGSRWYLVRKIQELCRRCF